MSTTLEEDIKKLVVKEMERHIEEFRLFQSLCAGRVHDDERGIAWLTWCIRNPEPTKF